MNPEIMIERLRLVADDLTRNAAATRSAGSDPRLEEIAIAMGEKAAAPNKFLDDGDFWQPIETVPKDGDPVMLGNNRGHPMAPLVSFIWHENKKTWMDSMNDNGLHWPETDEGLGGGNLGPTHWRRPIRPPGRAQGDG